MKGVCVEYANEPSHDALLDAILHKAPDLVMIEKKKISTFHEKKYVILRPMIGMIPSWSSFRGTELRFAAV